MEKIYFAGGCFWCMVKPFDSYEGIISVKSGYMGGHVVNPTYEQVKSGHSGHLEVVEIVYDETLFPFKKLLEIFFNIIDPTDNQGQFQDRGSQYRTAVFCTTDAQKEQTKQYIKSIESRYVLPIVTNIYDESPFYLAEDYHQDFYKKNPERYQQEQLDRSNYKSKH